MAGIVVLALFIMTSLSVIEAKKASKLSDGARRDGPVDVETTESCVPGKFYQGPACNRCFCNADKEKVCSPPGTCKLSDKVPTTEQLIRKFNKVKLHLLPSLPNTGAECSPGMSYRVGCNRCLCDQSKSAVCDTLLCPSYDEHNKRQAIEMSGKPCHEGDIQKQECVKCSCDDGEYACEAKDGCISSVALLKLQRGTTKRHMCFPGKTYPNPNGGPACTCTIFAELKCPLGKSNTRKPRSRNTRSQPGPRTTLQGKMRETQPDAIEGVGEKLFDKAFLDPDSKKKCTPGVVYHDDCNRCTCSDERILFCTTMLCMEDIDVDPGVLERQRPTPRKKKTANTSDVALKRKCTPGRSYHSDCNRCVCSKNGHLSCTKMWCPKAKDVEKEGNQEHAAEA